MGHLVDRMRIDAEIVHVQSSGIGNEMSDLITPKNTDPKSPSVQIVMQPDTPAAKNKKATAEMSKESKTKTVTIADESQFTYDDKAQPPAYKEQSHTNEITEISEMTKEHTNHTMIEPSVDSTPLEEKSQDSKDGDKEGNTIKRKRRRKVSEFAVSKMAKYKRVGETIQKYSKDAKLCLITMPYPRKKFEWWEFSHIIHDLTPKDVPSIFVRGTQDQVLTFAF